MLKCSIQTGQLDAFLLKASDYITQALKNELVQIVKEFDAEIRARGNWCDRTGNLRSSIGGAVYEDGRIFFQTAFQQVLNGAVGSAKGRSLVHELSGLYSDAISAVIVAGMEYAEIVEALESRDVLESARLKAESSVETRLRKAVEKASNEINGWQI